MSAKFPLYGIASSSLLKIGSTKARVFPLPVCASTMKSPSPSTRGIASLCTGVGVVIDKRASEARIVGLLIAEKLPTGGQATTFCSEGEGFSAVSI